MAMSVRLRLDAGMTSSQDETPVRNEHEQMEIGALPERFGLATQLPVTPAQAADGPVVRIRLQEDEPGRPLPLPANTHRALPGYGRPPGVRPPGGRAPDVGATSSARWCSESVRWSGPNGGNRRYSRMDCGTADQS